MRGFSGAIPDRNMVCLEDVLLCFVVGTDMVSVHGRLKEQRRPTCKNQLQNPIVSYQLNMVIKPIVLTSGWMFEKQKLLCTPSHL
jgi:hypothetical protein